MMTQKTASWRARRRRTTTRRLRIVGSFAVICSMVLFLVQKFASQGIHLSYHASPRHRIDKVLSDNDISTINLQRLQLELPLFQAPGTHYVNLQFGSHNNLQNVSLIVDTGSGVTAFPCSRCKGCDDYHLGQLYNETMSTSYQQTPCHTTNDCAVGKCYDAPRSSGHTDGVSSDSYCRIRRHYSEGSSWSAMESTDTVQIDSGIGMNLTFGCQTSIHGLFSNQLADGIMGMDWLSGSFWQQAFDNKLIDRRSFGLCLKQLEHDIIDTTAPAGILTLGASDAGLNKTPMVYADMQKVDHFYGVYVENIHLRMHGGGSVEPDRQSHFNKLWYETVNMRSSSLNRESFIIDSGTTMTYLSEHLKYPFSDAWKSLTGKHYSTYREYVYDREELNDYLPTILFQLSPWRRSDNDRSAPWIVNSLDRYNRGSILVAMPPSNYMRFIAEDNVWVSRIFFTSASKQTLGSNFMQGKNVLFDMDHNRIGFAESSCTANPSVSRKADAKERQERKDILESVTEKLHNAAIYLRQKSRTFFVVVLTVLALLIGFLTSFLMRRSRISQQVNDRQSSMAGESQPLLISNSGTGNNLLYLQGIALDVS